MNHRKPASTMAETAKEIARRYSAVTGVAIPAPPPPPPAPKKPR